MDGKQLRQLKPELDLFLERYLPLFGRSENHAHAAEFVHGLLGAAERRNIENIAEAVNGGVVRTMQKFISQSCWNDAEVLAELRTHVAEVLGQPEATINVDETGFPKKGTKSVGVKRQYSGTLGRVDNCQVGVMANYCSTQGHTLIDRRLFLPQEWVDDNRKTRRTPDDESETHHQTDDGRGSGGNAAGERISPHHGRRGEPGTDRLRICRDASLVFRREPSRHGTGTSVGAALARPGAGVEIPSVERAPGNPAPASRLPAGAALDDRAGHPGRQRRKRPRRIRNPRLDRLASPYGSLPAGVVVPRAAATADGGKKKHR